MLELIPIPLAFAVGYLGTSWLFDYFYQKLDDIDIQTTLTADEIDKFKANYFNKSRRILKCARNGLVLAGAVTLLVIAINGGI